MSKGSLFMPLARAIDPKRDVESELPRPLLFARKAIDYLFRVSGYFLVMCLTVGLLLSNCSEDPFLGVMPYVLGASFVFYLILTLFGIPAFLAIGEIENPRVRRAIAYPATLLMLLISVWMFIETTFFDVLVEYVLRLFPTANGCDAFLISE